MPDHRPLTGDRPAREPSDGGVGHPHPNDRWFALLYDDLRRVAERQLRRNGAPPMSPTTLLHETYIDLQSRRIPFPDRGRFVGYAARVMRGLIIDFVRERRAIKRGGGFHITQVDTALGDETPDVAALDELSAALDDLAAHDPRLAEVVDLKYFCGYSLGEIAELRGNSERTVQRDWEKARLFLYAQLAPPSPET